MSPVDPDDILAAIGRRVPLIGDGPNRKARCPFHHECTPSFVVLGTQQAWHCFGCRIGGDLAAFEAAWTARGLPR